MARVASTRDTRPTGTGARAGAGSATGLRTWSLHPKNKLRGYVHMCHWFWELADYRNCLSYKSSYTVKWTVGLRDRRLCLRTEILIDFTSWEDTKHVNVRAIRLLKHLAAQFVRLKWRVYVAPGKIIE
jgi:hypothetical protein